MNDTETIQGMTAAMRMLDKTIKSLKYIESSKTKNIENGSCPFCGFFHDTLVADLERMNSLRKAFIEKSRSNDKDEKIIAASAVMAVATETIKKYATLQAFLDISHNAISDIIESRFGEINLDDNPEIKEALESIVKSAGVSMTINHGFDPSKAN